MAGTSTLSEYCNCLKLVILNIDLLIQCIFEFFFITRALNACDVHTFTKVSGQYPEIAAHEKIVDNFIELLRTDRVC